MTPWALICCNYAYFCKRNQSHSPSVCRLFTHMGLYVILLRASARALLEHFEESLVGALYTFR